MTFTSLKAPLFFLLPFSVCKALGITAFLDMVIWTNILAEMFSLLWKYPPCGEQSRALFEAEFPAVSMCSLNSLMEYFKEKLRHSLIS